MSYEAVADMTLALDGVPTAERLTAEDGWQPTLVCENAKGTPCGSDPRYALAVGKDRYPRLISRILLKLIPRCRSFHDRDAVGARDHQRGSDSHIKAMPHDAGDARQRRTELCGVCDGAEGAIVDDVAVVGLVDCAVLKAQGRGRVLITDGVAAAACPVDGALVRVAFDQAAGYFADTAARVPPGTWEKPGLGVWSVRALVGHTSRALLTVERYLETGAEQAGIANAAEYYLRAPRTAADDASIAERGRLAGMELGDDPAGAVRVMADRVTTRVHAADDMVLVGTPWGGMAILEYLQTRIFELTIHTQDLIAALDLNQAAPVPDEAFAVTFALVGRLAHGRHLEMDLLLAATGRRALPAGYSIL